MSLIVFHRLLIATAIIFCAGFAVWELLNYRAQGGALAIVLACAFAVAAGVLGYYLRHLSRFLGLPEGREGSQR